MAGNKNSGRKAGFEMTEHHKTKIRNSKILSRLIAHAEGTLDPDAECRSRRPMDATQVTAALSLVDRVLPKLSHKDHDHNIEGNVTTKVIIGGTDA